MSGIYIHIPFCKQACHYCDFHFSTSLKRKDEMVLAMVKELELRKKELQGEIIETIYFGGGTPSLLTIEELNKILQTVYANYRVGENPEITLEANPDDLSKEKIQELANTKVNRLSIGIQSFFEDDLKFMNRAHTAKESEECIKESGRYFENITIDLIYGVPGMTTVKWLANLHKAFELNVPHISSYALTVEEKTALSSFIKKGTCPPLDEELALEHFNLLVSETEKNGFVQYEISNFGKPGYFSKHNSSYWQGKKYIGIGPSAHSFNGEQRGWNVANNAKYIKALLNTELALNIEKLTKEDQFNEYIMTGLRTIYGVSLFKIEQDFGIGYKDVLLREAEPFIQNNTLAIKEDTLFTTKTGKFLADGIASSLFILS